MVGPQIEAAADIHIHAATGAVWQIFQDVSRWPQWHPQVREAAWAAGEPWAEGSKLRLALNSPLGFPVTTTATVRMAVPANTVVWEGGIGGVIAVHTVRFSDELGGCRIHEREVYHGLLAFGMGLLKGRQEVAFAQALTTLKSLVEGLPRR